eukprot:2667750-Amphidinium_carterae.1
MAGTPWSDSGPSNVPSPWSSIWPPMRAQGAGTSTQRGQAAVAVQPLTDNHRPSPLDTPPSWNGANPEQQLSGYLKAVEAWNLTTRLPHRQRGVAVLGQASGDLRQLIATLEIEELTADNGADTILQLLRKEYGWTLQRSLPQRFEAALFSAAGRRQANESLLSFTARKMTLLKELQQAGVSLPSTAQGLVVLRDAGLSKSENECFLQWSKGAYDIDTVVSNLRNLDRVPQQGHGHKTHLWTADEEWEYEQWQEGEWNEADPEAWDPESEDPTPEEDTISEDAAQLVYAMHQGQPSKYIQHRRDIQHQRLERGWPSGAKAKAKGKGSPGAPAKGKGKGDKNSLQALIARTKCARCGQVGHWARTCTQEPQAAASASKGDISGAKTSYSSFFVHGMIDEDTEVGNGNFFVHVMMDEVFPDVVLENGENKDVCVVLENDENKDVCVQKHVLVTDGMREVHVQQYFGSVPVMHAFMMSEQYKRE